MSRETKHTPWETSSNAQGDWDICEAGGGDMVADLKGCPNAEEHARLIVRAVNTHADLMAAAEAVLPILESMDIGREEGDDPIPELEALRAAIAKAKGGE
jgi:hypothetical protein